MTDQAWETLSNQAIAAAGVVYFLSLLANLVQWASLRNAPVGRTASRKVAVGSGGLESEAVHPPWVSDPEVKLFQRPRRN